MQGNAPRNDALAAVATGPLKFDGPPPGLNLCDPFTGLGTTYLPTHLVTADADAATFGGTSTSNSSSTPREGLVGLARLASINRELCANDPQYGFDSKGPGQPSDRNVELFLPAPAWVSPLAVL